MTKRPRQTCTNCSVRHVKCDRKIPCTRCIRKNEADSCSREWENGYDPQRSVHPKWKRGQSSHNSIASGPVYNGVPQHTDRNRPLMQNGSPIQGSHPQRRTTYDVTNLNFSHPSLRTTSADDVRQAAPDSHQPPQAVDEPGSPIWGSDRSSDSVSSSTPSSISESFSAESFANGSHHSPVRSGPHDFKEQHLQSLVPTNSQISRLVEYHEQSLLWYHGCVHGPAFRVDLNKALQGSDGLQLKGLDFRWSALLFSIMTASLTCSSDITCSSDTLAHSWGFSKAQKHGLSKQWYEASVVCLRLGEYTSQFSLYSIQAIQILSISAHAIGSSDEQFVFCRAALGIAQNLGLQRLAQEPELDNFPTISTRTSLSQENILIKREVGRRIWARMCTQDWFSIPSSDMYTINRQHFTTTRPCRIDDEKLKLAGDHVIVATDSVNLLYDIASLMADFHDSITALSDLAAKYDQVLRYDSKMRALGTQSMRQLFSSETIEASGSQWVRWAKGVASIVQVHKIIMIHRGFLGKSFTDPRYTYTRWAAVTASKTIIREVEIATADVDRPAFWQDQAHVISAGITLCLDILHRPRAEPEFAEHKKLVEQAVALLGSYDDSTLAVRGARLLSSLLEGATKQQPPRRHARHDQENNAYPHYSGSWAWPLEDRQDIDSMWALRQSNSEDDDPQSTVSSVIFSQQRRRSRATFVTTLAGDIGCHDVSTETTNDLEVMDDEGSFNAINSVKSDISWWTTFFSDYFPVQSINRSFVEDFTPQPT